MAPSRHLWYSATCALTLLGLALTAAHAEDVDGPPPYVYQELRFGVVGAPAPTVRQGGHNYSGDSRGYHFGVTYLHGKAPFNDYFGTVWGAQLSIGSYDVATARSDSQSLTQTMLDVYYGFQYGIVQTEALRGWGEILPYIGGGFNKLSGDGPSGQGTGLETGVRAGAYLTERKWLAGLTADYIYGQSKITPDKGASVLTRTNGFAFGVELGYRF